MRLQSKQRWLLYALAFGLTLTAVFDQDSDSGAMGDANAAVVQPAQRKEFAEPAPVAQLLPLEKLQQRHNSTEPGTDPFSSRSWQQMDADEARKNAPPVPPPPPQAPPLPYAYMGKMIEGDQTVVFLSTRDRAYVARVGDTLDGVWHVLAIQDERMSFDYVPLKLKQHLSFSSGASGGPRSALPRPKNEEDEDEDGEAPEE